MKITLSLLAACIFSLSVFAQPATQNANNKAMGDPIPGVGVNLTTPSGQLVQQVKTDAQGNATFSSVPKGQYLLTIVSPRDVATGQASGKRTTTHEIKSPRDAASGLPTGKRLAENANGTGATGDNSAGVSTSRSNVRTVAAEVLVTGDPDTPPAKNVENAADEVFVVDILENTSGTQKTVNTSRSNIKKHKIEHSGDPHEYVYEVSKTTVNANGQITFQVLKTKHDTVKNSINNVR